MNDNNKKASSGGIGFCGLLALVFIVLKLCNVITWSWLWVLAPIWMPLGLGIVVVCLVLLGVLIAGKKK